MNKIKNVEELSSILDNDLTLLIIKESSDNSNDDLLDDLNDLYDEIKLIVMDLDVNDLDVDTTSFLNGYFVSGLPFAMLFENKKIIKIMNSIENLDWIDMFILGELNV